MPNVHAIHSSPLGILARSTAHLKRSVRSYTHQAYKASQALYHKSLQQNNLHFTMTLLEKEGPSTASYSGESQGEEHQKGYGYGDEVCVALNNPNNI